MKALLIILIFLLPLALFAQDVTWKNYTIRDGLSHGNVYRIFQDRKGFLWFSTDYGMCSFDGRTFRSDFKDSTGFLSTSVMSVSEGEDGNKIVCTVNELLRFTDSSVRKYPMQRSNQLIGYFFAKERNGRLWAIAHYLNTSTKCLLQVHKGKTRYLDIVDDTGARVEFHTLSEYRDELLFAASNGLYVLRDTSVIKLFPELVTETVFDVARDRRGRYWLTYHDRVVVIADGRKVVETHLPDNNHINNAFLDREDHLWIATEEGGVLRMVEDKAEEIPGLGTISSIIVNDIFQDFEGNIWLATYGSGLFMLHSMNILHHTSGSNIQNIYTRELSVVNDKLWIGTIGNVYELDKGLISPVPVKMQSSEHYTYFIKQVKDKVFIGTAFRLIRKDLHAPSAEKAFLPAVISMCEDARGRLWFGGYRSVFQLVNDSLMRHPMNDFMGDKRVNTLCEDSKGNIWCGTGYGAYVFHPDRKQATRQVLPQLQIITDIVEDSQKRMWLAGTQGLACVEDDKYRIFNKKDGLASNNITAVLPVGNTLWVGTSGGLNLIDLNTMQVRYLTPIIFRDVILSLYSKGNSLYIGTANSVYSIDIADYDQSDSPPLVFITQVRAAGKEMNWPGKIELPYKENGLQINFIGISYQASHLVQYRYRIRGLDNKWRYTTNNLIEIPTLPSGSYTFILNARRNNGNWSDDVVMDIEVATPFWRTWWFLVVLALVLAAVLFLLTRRHTLKAEASKRKKLEVYNKMAYLRQQALSALINPHFIFNCMNSIQHFVNNNDNEMANEYMADFAQLIRMTLEDAQETFLPLEKEISRIRLYLSLEQLRFENKLQYTIEIAPGINVKSVKIPNMILQPYVENAIWHGIMPKDGEGTINVRFMEDNGRLKIEVEDDGVGISKDTLTTMPTKKGHYGIHLTRERLQLLKELSGQYYSINITVPHSGIGTGVEIFVPLSPNEDILEKMEDVKL